VSIQRCREIRRNRQTEQVMPLIGALLDAWDGVANDLRSQVADESPALFRSIEAIVRAMGSA
jgi:hypothetical protein